MKVYLICPVRRADDSSTAIARDHVAWLESYHNEVHWPQRDTPQDDPIGADICEANCEAIECADRIDILWDAGSSGSKFDLGMAFALKKPIRLIRPVEYQLGIKSFENLLNNWPWNSSPPPASASVRRDG